MHRGSNTLHRNRKTIVRRLFDEVLCRVRSTLNHRYWTVPRGLLQWVVPLSAPTTQGSMRVCSRIVSAGCLQRSHPDLRKGVELLLGLPVGYRRFCQGMDSQHGEARGPQRATEMSAGRLGAGALAGRYNQTPSVDLVVEAHRRPLTSTARSTARTVGSQVRSCSAAFRETHSESALKIRKGETHAPAASRTAVL
jgi:hypothetical protein